MTKNKARKLAAHTRAAATGERYVVARRDIQDASSPEAPSGVLHRLTHRVPRVPAHVDGGLQRERRRPRARRAHLRSRHGEPRVLVAWQNWIARRVSRG